MSKITSLFLITISLLASCGKEVKHNLNRDALYYQIAELDEGIRQQKYQRLCENIGLKRQIFNSSNTSIKNVQDYLLTTMVDSVFHFWYDTDWDFNGITQKPNQGSIACGYFVTTTLLHSGLNIDRVKIAQQASSKIIQTLCKRESIKSFYNKNFKGLKEYLKSSNDGLYIIGLDNHVGFIHKKDTSIVMIHSGANTGIVCRQRIDECGPVKYSKVHVIGNLLENDALIKKWLKNERVSLTQ